MDEKLSFYPLSNLQFTDVHPNYFKTTQPNSVLKPLVLMTCVSLE